MRISKSTDGLGCLSSNGFGGWYGAVGEGIGGWIWVTRAIVVRTTVRGVVDVVMNLMINYGKD